MTFDVTKRTKGFWRGKIRIAGLAGILLSIVVAWTVFWQIAAKATDKTLNAWMDREAITGHIWTCPEKNIGGYPFWIEISCVSPKFDGELSGNIFHGSLAGFRAFASLFHPREINAEMRSPFSARSEADDFSFRLDWSALEIALAGSPDSLRNLALLSRDLVLDGSFGSLAPLLGKAGKLAIFFEKQVERGGHAFAFQLTLTNGTSPALATLLGSSIPADLGFKGTITGFDLSKGANALEKIDEWRMSGGNIDFDLAEFSQADLKLSAKGRLGLDSSHRIEGKLEAQLSGSGPILRRFGINPALLDAASLIGALTGKAPGGSNAAPHSLRVPLTFANGVLSIGPLRTPLALQPIY